MPSSRTLQDDLIAGTLVGGVGWLPKLPKVSGRQAEAFCRLQRMHKKVQLLLGLIYPFMTSFGTDGFQQNASQDLTPSLTFFTSLNP